MEAVKVKGIQTPAQTYNYIGDIHSYRKHHHIGTLLDNSRTVGKDSDRHWPIDTVHVEALPDHRPNRRTSPR